MDNIKRPRFSTDDNGRVWMLWLTLYKLSPANDRMLLQGRRRDIKRLMALSQDFASYDVTPVNTLNLYKTTNRHAWDTS